MIPLAFAAAAFASSSRSTAIARRRAASSPAGAMLLCACFLDLMEQRFLFVTFVLLCRAIDRGEDSFEDSAETKGFNE